jgi:hypothetical protein
MRRTITILIIGPAGSDFVALKLSSILTQASSSAIYSATGSKAFVSRPKEFVSFPTRWGALERVSYGIPRLST